MIEVIFIIYLLMLFLFLWPITTWIQMLRNRRTQFTS